MSIQTSDGTAVAGPRRAASGEGPEARWEASPGGEVDGRRAARRATRVLRRTRVTAGSGSGGGRRYPRRRAPADGDLRPAAFFDLDKTVIAKASMVAFSGPLHRAGMLSRRLMLKAAWGQLVYAQIGATPEKLEKLRESVLAPDDGLGPGRDLRDRARDPRRRHRADRVRRGPRPDPPAPGVGPQGVHRVGVTRGGRGPDRPAPRRRRGHRHPGRARRRRPLLRRTERYVYGPEKEVAILEVAARDGLDLAHSWAYSDSATDVPMLSAVGHPVAVNPDRELAKVAKERGWQVEHFRLEVPLRDRVPMPAPRRRPRWAAARRCSAPPRWPGWWWWRRHGPAPTSTRADQASRTFFAAKAARLARTMSSSSFFMPEASRRARASALDATGAVLDGEEVAGAGVARGVAQLRHRPGLDLADALTGEVEVLARPLRACGARRGRGRSGA